MGKFFIIHGTHGSPEGNWFPWLKAELSNKGHAVVVPEMPTPENQSLENWFQAFESQAGDIREDDIIIGHSAGAILLLRILEKRSSPIRCAVFVCGFTSTLGIPEYDKLNLSFIDKDFDWEQIRANAERIICIHGDNDPYVPLSQSLDLASNLKVLPISIKGGGHLNSESGYTEFPLLLDLIKKIENPL